MASERGNSGDERSARRTPAGDVILRTRRPERPAQRRRRVPAGAHLRVWAAVLALIAVGAALVTVVALVGDGPLTSARGVPVIDPGATSGGAAPTVTGSAAPTRIRPYPTTPAAPTAPPRGPAGPGSRQPAAGDLVAARQRVSGFVAALNNQDFARANVFLCESMAGSYGPGSLGGVVPGSLEVGGVTLQDDTGTAIVTFRLTGSSEPGRMVFTMVIEHGRWMVCHPQ